MSVNLEYYKTFYYVATLGSMSKAASHMCLTPPTITKTIQLLEEQLNCQLFFRSVKGVRLTSAGEALLRKVQPGMNMLLSGEEEIHMINSLERGTIRIGLSEAAANAFIISDEFTKFTQKYSGISIIMKHLSFQETHDMILSGEIDFGVHGVFPEDCKDLKTRTLNIMPSVATVGAKYKHLAQSPISLYELAEYPLIFVDPSYEVSKYYKRLYAKYNLDFQPHIEAPTLNMQIYAVESGLGYSFLPLSNIHKKCEEGKLFIADIQNEELLQRPTCILYSNDIPLSLAASTLVNMFKNPHEQDDMME
ncbi:LysR family transcriptional regulator [Eubacterium oxidoreducens]|uniref:DNA-binding transcriptional regulator, LysR family n=1 Tax=Eubacterium oxidoreducens TaxID=1732 RepID=A0A1G6CJC1_EUBOX|nr:LysR family transcriptional regulator [Eubacterium oxidoreducens]SDB32970.1 DNA-binding transcriptional regulator, LysR family [Eubacterium oxidoreducens]